MPADAPPALVAPVDGGVVRAFRYDRSRPFVGGARRTVLLAASPGEAVGAACSGRVSFAGRLPQGRGVTVRCGRWSATHLGLASVTVARGARVGAGRRLGRAAGPVSLGVRRTGDRWGWVAPRLDDPPPRGAPPLGPAPRPGLRVPEEVPARRPVPVGVRAPEAVPREAPGPRPAPGAPPEPVPGARPVSEPGGVPRPEVRPGPGAAVAPWPVWGGLGLVLAALAGAGTAGARRARRPVEGRRPRVVDAGLAPRR